MSAAFGSKTFRRFRREVQPLVNRQLNHRMSSRGTERRCEPHWHYSPKETLKPLCNVGAARCLTCSETLRVRRLRLGAPKFLFHPDRIDQMLRQLPDG
jgi:hypothetical protein